MIASGLENAVTFFDLKWDTEFFGVTCARAILHRPLKLNEWDQLKDGFGKYQFISIQNQNSEPVNAQFVGKDTSAFLADANIQFLKTITPPYEIPTNVTVHQALERNDRLINVANFQFSKFTEDGEFAKRGGDQVYRQWIINSFGKNDKFYALSIAEQGDVNGFVLFSFLNDACVIELIAASKTVTRSGIGTSLFTAVEHSAHKHGYSQIRVGTQLRNIGAINFYHKVGCKQVGCHQVYHLWNL